jgi:hypothetical protein
MLINCCLLIEKDYLYHMKNDLYNAPKQANSLSMSHLTNKITNKNVEIMNKATKTATATKPTFRLSVLDLQCIEDAMRLRIEYLKEMEQSTFSDEMTLRKVSGELKKRLQKFGAW